MLVLLRTCPAFRGSPVPAPARSITIMAIQQQKKKCLVIGAGFAGLAAARRLQTLGGEAWDVAILEASQRVGGRAHTVQLTGCGTVELGATWLHGLQGNPLYSFALEAGIMSPKAKQKDEAWGWSTWVREGELQPLSTGQVKLAKAAAGSYSMAVQRSMESDEPGLTVGQHLRRSWPQAYARLDSQHLAAEVWAWREKLQRSIDGCTTTDDMLARGLAAYDELDDLNVPVPGGFQGLAERLAEGLDIRFGSTVAKIEWSEKGATVHCGNGQSVKADAVIVTISLGVLKATYQSMFAPPLPASKVEAIARMGIGTVNKVFLTSKLPDGQAPQQKASSYSLLWKLPSDAADSWAETAPEQRVGKPAWLSGAYALRMRGSEFVAPLPDAQAAAVPVCPAGGAAASSGPVPVVAGTQPVGKDAASEQGGGACSAPGSSDRGSNSTAAAGSTTRQVQAAAMWVAGPEASAMELRSDAELAGDVAALLDVFPPVQQQLPNVQEAFRSSWGTDPLFRGSYSYIAAGSSLQDVEELGRPVGPLLFCGEATHSSHFGTANGAFLTGEREADRLLSQ